jgi:tRNA(Ile)-lysidine synthase
MFAWQATMNEPVPTSRPPGQPATPDELVRAVAAFIDQRRLLSAGQAVLVAVSGGCDSVALLEILCQLAGQPERRWNLSVAHLNHRLRPDADADADFVRDLAGRHGLPCVVEAVDVAAIAAARAMSTETAARAARYEFLAQVARRLGATAVATGHHADDNVETILQRIIRGTHLRGLRGIPVQRPLAGAPGVQLIRPLLAVRREQIEQFCIRRGLGWRMDSTNADTVHRRNFIRHELLPLMRDRMNPRVDDALLRLADAAGDTEDHLAETGQALLDRARRAGKDPDRLALDAARLAEAPTVHRCYALRAALECLRAPMGGLSAGQLADLAALPAQPPPAAITLPGGILARREGDMLLLEPDAAAGHLSQGPAEAPNWHIRLPAGSGSAAPRDDGTAWSEEVGGTFRGEAVTLPDGRMVRCEEVPLDPAAFAAQRANPRPGEEWLDADYVRWPLMIRPRQPGDAFIPLGASGRQTVSDFLTNAKLHPARRREAFIVADEQGIIYVAPLRIADHTRIRDTTRRVLRIEVLPADEED